MGQPSQQQNNPFPTSGAQWNQGGYPMGGTQWLGNQASMAGAAGNYGGGFSSGPSGMYQPYPYQPGGQMPYLPANPGGGGGYGNNYQPPLGSGYAPNTGIPGNPLARGTVNVQGGLYGQQNPLAGSTPNVQGPNAFQQQPPAQFGPMPPPMLVDTANGPQYQSNPAINNPFLAGYFASAQPGWQQNNDNNYLNYLNGGGAMRVTS